MAKIDVKVPDIGDFKDVPVIEVLVKPGDVVKVDQSLITLESDKATMDVPSPVAGAVAEVVAKVGDKVSMGTLIARVESADGEARRWQGGPASPPLRRLRPPRSLRPLRRSPPPAFRRAAGPRKAAPIDVTIPDIGDFKDVPIIEILVKAGDTVEADQPLLTLESDKATHGRAVAGGGQDHADCRQGRRQSLDGRADREARRGTLPGPTTSMTTARRRKKRTPPKRRKPRPLRRATCRPRRPSLPRVPPSPISPAFSPGPRFAGLRASSASTSIRSRGPARKAASPERTSRRRWSLGRRR